MKDYPLIFRIARTHLLTRMKQTITATLGVTFGIAIFIFLISMITGSNNMIQDVLLTNAPHIHIYKEIEAERTSVLDKVYAGENYMNIVHHIKPQQDKTNIKDGFRMVELIGNDERVLGVSPYISSQVFYRYGSADITGNIIGVDIEAEDRLFNIGEKVIGGEINQLYSTYNGTIMGVGLSKKLNVKVGDRINITTPQGRTLTLTIVALLKTGLTEVDNSQSYATIGTVQKILGENQSYVTDIKIKLHDLDIADKVAAEYEQQFGYKAVDWMTANASFLVGMQLNNIIAYGVGIAILVVAGFGIFNILTMLIYEKMKDIAILKAMGFSGPDVRKIFMTEALVIGLIGALIGLLVGFLMSYAMEQVPYENEILVTMDHLPINYNLAFYVGGVTFGLITTALAGFFPSRKAAKIDPIEILRG